jgi:hypothetical protein
MTSPAESALTPFVPSQTDSRWALREAMLAERLAYEAMRELVPDLALPRARRGALSARQQAAIDEYQVLRDRLEALRSARRSPGLHLVEDQSL